MRATTEEKLVMLFRTEIIPYGKMLYLEYDQSYETKLKCVRHDSAIAR